MVVWDGLTNSWEKKRSKSQMRKWKIYTSAWRAPKNSRRDNKTFLSDQCKEIGGNNRIGKTRNLFKKIRNTKGKFHAKMSTIKDRNGMDLTEAEDIKKRWQDYTEELCKRDLNDPDNHLVWSRRARYFGVWSQVVFRKYHCKQSLWRYGIPVELFQILKDDAVKVLHSICQHIWKTQQWP